MAFWRTMIAPAAAAEGPTGAKDRGPAPSRTARARGVSRPATGWGQRWRKRRCISFISRRMARISSWSSRMARCISSGKPPRSA